MLKITDEIAIEDWELSEQFIRASGPGGQNVNKVASAVELRFEAARSPNLPAPVKTRLKRLAGRRWTGEGAIVLQCDETRSQVRNREIVRDRLAEFDPAGRWSPRNDASRPAPRLARRNAASRPRRCAAT